MQLSIGGRRSWFPLARIFRLLRQAAAAGLEMRRVWVGRRAIAQMDARMLADIGLSRAEALEEVRRRPWDVRPRR